MNSFTTPSDLGRIPLKIGTGKLGFSGLTAEQLDYVLFTWFPQGSYSISAL